MQKYEAVCVLLPAYYHGTINEDQGRAVLLHFDLDEEVKERRAEVWI